MPPVMPDPDGHAVGGMGRRTAQRHRGVWLLALDLGGKVHRYAEREVAVYSRDLGATVPFVSGLSSPDFMVGSESASVVVRAADAQQWARSRAALGPLSGRAFRLWRWYEGDLEEAALVLQGVAEGASWGDVADPLALTLTLRRSLRALSLVVPLPQHRVDDSTWPVRPAYPQDEGIQGAAYPVVIGCPGSEPLAIATTPRPASPGLLVEGLGHPTSVLLIAGHRVQATQVRVWDMSASPPESEDRTVQYTTDKLGQEVAYTDFVGSTFSAPAAEGHEYMVGWDRRTSYGGGAVDGDRLVAGLGDLLIYGARKWSRAVHDFGQMEALRGSLNSFRIDTVMNDPARWDDILAGNFLDLYELDVVHGQRGVYYQQRRYVADPVRGRATLITARDGSGFRVVRVGPVVDSSDDVVNEATIEYDPSCMTTTYRRRLTIGPRHGVYEGGAEDARHGVSLACQASHTLYQLRPHTWQTVTTSDPATAQLLARMKVQRHALPAQLATYRGGAELAGLRKYDTVTLHDSTPGASFQGAQAVVWDLVLEAADTFSVVLRVPTDPLRAPTWST